jgi:Rha family phage regulatory protein
MANIATLGASAPTLTVVDGVPTTTSTDVARFFVKQHRDVLRAIENLTTQLPGEPLRNFAQGSYTLPETGDQQHKMYRLTKDGFALLAMGFTGKKALAFKLAYLDAFNQMETALAGERRDPDRRQNTPTETGESIILKLHSIQARNLPDEQRRKIVKQVREMWPALLPGDAPPVSLLSRRWLVYFDDERREVVREIPPDAAVMTPTEFMKRFNDPNFTVSDKELWGFAEATFCRLRDRMEAA